MAFFGWDMETIKVFLETLNGNLGGLFVLAMAAYGFYKAGEYSKAFRRLPALADDVHQLKLDVSKLQFDVGRLDHRLTSVESKLDHIAQVVDKLLGQRTER